MDKKVGVSILYGLILLVGLIGVTKFAISFGDDTFRSESASVTDVLGQVNVSLWGDGYSNDSYTKGGASEMVNVTILYGLDNSTVNGNITNITIEWDAAANYTFLGFVGANFSNGVDFEFVGACTDDGLGLAGKCDTFNSSTEFDNVTLNQHGGIGEWVCRNLTDTMINCNNATDNDGLSSINTSLQIFFNVTAAADVENDVVWNITTYMNVSDLNSIGNSTNLSTFIDGLPPQITDINITDGNITLYNATQLGNKNDFNISDEYTLSPNAALTILASVYDLNLDGIQGTGTLRLYYNNTATGVGDTGGSGNLTALGNSGKGSTAEVANASFVDGVIVNTWRSDKVVDRVTSSALVSWTIPQLSGDDIFNITKFQFLLNDSYDLGIVVQEDAKTDGIDAPFTVSRNSSIIPLVQSFNITQDDGTAVLNGNLVNNSFLAAGNWTITADISGKGVTNVSIFYNETGNFGDMPSVGAPFINGVIPSASDEITEATPNYVVRNTSGYAFNAADTVGWTTNLEINSVNDTNLITFVVVVNGSLMGGIEGDEQIIGFNTSAANFSVVAGPYYIKVDASAPAPELNTPTTRGISTGDSIEYKCTANEPASGVQKYIWYLKKPGSDNTYTKISEVTTSDSTNTKKFSGTDINTVGTYTVRCEVTDNVGNVNYKDTTGSNDFTVSISSSGGGSSGGGSGGGGAGAAVSFDVDFTAAPQATFKASQGRVKSFSFDGVTKHTITFNEITADGATLVIASDPITVKLNAGQSKSVDVNADGADDMKVQLNGVDNGVADVTVTKLEAGAAKVRAEEEKARDTEAGGGEEREVTPVGGRNLAWLWWTLIVIVAIVAIGYYVNKRK